MKTLAELRTEARSLFNETDPNNTHVDNSMLTGWANEAVRYILTKTKDIPKKEGSLTSATGDISISSSTLTIDEAYILRTNTGKYDKLEVIDLSFLQNIDPGWLSTTAGEPKYLVRKDTFTLYLYPQPSTTGETIKTYGMEFPADMALDVDTPSKLPINLVDIIPHFMAYRAFAQLNMHDKAGFELEYFRSMVKAQREISTVGSNSGQMWRVADTDDTY